MKYQNNTFVKELEKIVDNKISLKQMSRDEVRHVYGYYMDLFVNYTHKNDTMT